MSKPKWVIIDSVKLSTKFLVLCDSGWIRICRMCSGKFPPTTEHFYMARFGLNPAMSRVCKTCRIKEAESHTGQWQCSKCGQFYDATPANFKKSRGQLAHICRKCHNRATTATTREHKKRYPRRHWEYKVLSSAKMRATRKGIEWDREAIRTMALTYIDKSRCPCCGVIMGNDVGGKHRWPALDRVDNEKGYVEGNMVFICYRCNNLKSNGTLEEFEKIVEYMKEYL